MDVEIDEIHNIAAHKSVREISENAAGQDSQRQVQKPALRRQMQAIDYNRRDSDYGHGGQNVRFPDGNNAVKQPEGHARIFPVGKAKVARDEDHGQIPIQLCAHGPLGSVVKHKYKQGNQVVPVFKHPLNQ